MSSSLDNFAARLSTQLHESLDATPIEDVPWAAARPSVAAHARRRRRRSRMTAAATMLAAAAAVTAAVVVAQPSRRHAANPVTPSQPHALTVLAAAAVGGTTPASLAAGGGSVFAGLWDSGQLLRLDPTTLHTTATLQIGSAGSGPLSIAYGNGAVWVLNFDDGRLWRVDPATMTATLKVQLPAQPSQVAVGAGAVWVTGCCTSSDTSTRQRLIRINPETGAITDTRVVAGDGETVPLAVGPEVVATSQNGPILVVDPNTMDVVSALPDVCAGCDETAGLVAGPEGLYVTSLSSVARYDPHSGRRLATSSAMSVVPMPLSVQSDGVWIAAGDRLLRLDPTSLAVTAQAPVAVTGHLVELSNSIYVSSAGVIDRLGPTN
jgi:outer membrane protein assembly factor BamB